MNKDRVAGAAQQTTRGKPFSYDFQADDHNTEHLMKALQANHTKNYRLRVVFSDTVMSFIVAADTTFGDVARRLDKLSVQRYGNPVAIDVITNAAARSALPN